MPRTREEIAHREKPLKHRKRTASAVVTKESASGGGLGDNMKKDFDLREKDIRQALKKEKRKR